MILICKLFYEFIFENKLSLSLKNWPVIWIVLCMTLYALLCVYEKIFNDNIN